MKLLHVFGLVAAIHAAAFTLFFAIPGCRSAGKSKPLPEDTDPRYAGANTVSPDAIGATSVEPMSYDEINAPAPSYSASPTAVSRVTPVVPPAGSGSPDGIRYNPTRPNVPAAAAPLAVVTPPAAASAIHLVAAGDNLWSIARKYGISVAELAAANRLAPSATLRIGQALTVPAQGVSPTAAASPGIATPANTYTVVSGDTLGGIARRHGVTVAALRTANNLSGDALRIDQKLVIPEGGTLAAAASAAPAVVTPRAGAGTYTVVAGDTLGGIARRTGVRVGDLALLNNITDPAKLRIGQVLKLPAGANAAGATAPVSPAPAAPVPVSAFGAPVEAITPVEPVVPVEPAAVPVIRIQ